MKMSKKIQVWRKNGHGSAANGNRTDTSTNSHPAKNGTTNNGGGCSSSSSSGGSGGAIGGRGDDSNSSSSSNTLTSGISSSNDRRSSKGSNTSNSSIETDDEQKYITNFQEILHLRSSVYSKLNWWPRDMFVPDALHYLKVQLNPPTRHAGQQNPPNSNSRQPSLTNGHHPRHQQPTNGNSRREAPANGFGNFRSEPHISHHGPRLQSQHSAHKGVNGFDHRHVNGHSTPTGVGHVQLQIPHQNGHSRGVDGQYDNTSSLDLSDESSIDDDEEEEEDNDVDVTSSSLPRVKDGLSSD